MTLFDPENTMTDQEKIEKAYSLLREVNDQVTRMWRIAFGIGHRNEMTFLDYDLTKKWIGEYGYEMVRDAFQEAGLHKVYNLAYVRKVLQSKNEKKAVFQERQFAEKKKEETKRVATDPTEWKGMFNEILRKNNAQ